MNYIVEENKMFNMTSGLTFIFDKVILRMYIDRKYNSINVYISKKDGVKRKSIDLSCYLYTFIEYLNNNILLGNDGKDIYRVDNIKHLNLEDLKITKQDIDIIASKFKSLRVLDTNKCTIYKDVKLGALQAHIVDRNSTIYDINSLSGYSGYLIKLDNTRVVRGPDKPLYLNNTVLTLIDININYELLFLYTKSNTLRKLDIYNKNKLNDKDLLFLGGLTNLESICIDAKVSNYNCLSKLEYLRRVYNIVIKKNPKEIVLVNKYLDLLNKLAVNREDKVWLIDMIHNDNAKNYIENLPLDKKISIKKEKIIH